MKNQMNKVFFVIVIPLLITSLCFFFSCAKKTECSGFTDDDMLGLPYCVGDTLMFVDQNDNNFIIPIIDIEKSQPYTFKCRDLNGICLCERYAEIIANNTASSTEFVLIRLEINSKSGTHIYRYNIENFNFEFDFENDPDYIGMMENFFIVDSLIISDTTYLNVFKVTNQDFEHTQVSSVFFNKSSGILKITKNNGTVLEFKHK